MKRIEYLNTLYMKELYDYEYYRKECEECDVDDFDMADEDSSAFYEWVSSRMDIDIDYFFDNLKYSEYNVRCMIVGNLGLWDGKHEIKPDYQDTLYDAVRKCLNSADDCIIFQEHGCINIDCYHHDGCNRFEIYILSDKGIDRYYRNGCCSVKNRENIKTLKDCLF